MKVIMSVGGVDKGKDFRHDLHLPSVPVESYEDWVKGIKDNENGKTVFESMGFNDRSSVIPTPDFVRVWKWCACENEDEVKYHDEFYKAVNVPAYRGFIKSESDITK